MDVQVLETVDLIVGLEVAGEVACLGDGLLLLQQGQRVLRGIGIAGVSPVGVAERCTHVWLIVATKELGSLVVCIDRTGGVDGKG